jgi:hypothetical protein
MTKSLHHSFDIELAGQYGIEEAIIIHHFQHWISHNKRLNRACHNSRTWSYQTLDEIAANFPYMNKSKVFDIIQKLCLGKSRKSRKFEFEFKPILMKGNFNKKKYDQTVWYAFIDEEKFIGLGNSKEVIGKSQNDDWEIPTPIPTSKTESRTDANKDNVKETMPLSKDCLKTVDLSKRFKLTLEQSETLSWLQHQNIDTSGGTLAYWCRNYSLSRLIAVYNEAKSKAKKSIGAYMNKLLKSEAILATASSKANKEYAQNFLVEFEWGMLEILEKYAKISHSNGYEEEIPYNMNSSDFQNKLYNVFINQG